MWHCHYCRAALTADTLQRNRLCPKCGSDLHCCKNCAHFDEPRNQCLEPESPWVRDRAVQNTCPFFEMRVTADSGKSDAQKNEAAAEAEKAKEAFRALFRSA